MNKTRVFQGIGEMCRYNSECQSDCCVTNSLNPQKFCTPQTVFLQCVSWKKVSGAPREGKKPALLPHSYLLLDELEETGLLGREREGSSQGW